MAFIPYFEYVMLPEQGVSHVLYWIIFSHEASVVLEYQRKGKGESSSIETVDKEYQGKK
jgi:hypothetical protein